MDILEHLGANGRGVLFLILLLFAVLAAVHWIVWMAGWGRFARDSTMGQATGAPSTTAQTPGGQPTIAYYVGTFVGQIITEFRHLLALVIVLLFAVTMFTIIWSAWGTPKDVLDGVQVVAASLGGLIGSIIGYYFGESAGKAAAAPGLPPSPRLPAPTTAQNPPPSSTAPTGPTSGPPASGPIPASAPPGAPPSAP